MEISSGVSVPYSSGQWLQRSIFFRRTQLHSGFSPLFIGSMAATSVAECLGVPELTFQSPIHRVNGCNGVLYCPDDSDDRVSVPYSSGQWLQRIKTGL